MAGIDKTYTDSYKEYKKFKDWANKQIVTFFDGNTERIGNWVWEYTESDFNGVEIPIMNTPVWLDIYLIQNCKIKFVKDRMKEVYSKDDFNKFKCIDLTSLPSDYKQNRKIKIRKIKKITKFSIHNKPYDSKYWWLQCDNDLWFNDETNKWCDRLYYPTNTNTAHVKSLKSLIRHLRKQHLPTGVVFTLTGKYIGEYYRIYVK